MRKVSFLFWNLNRRPLLSLVAGLVREHRIDVVILAECEIPVVGLLDELNSAESAKFSFPPNMSSHLTILTRFPRESLQMVRDTGGVAIRRLVPPVGLDILLVAVHLPSKMHQTDSDQGLSCTRIVRFVEEAERSVNHTRTIVVGDFNMNPFEFGVVGAEGFHAVMTRRAAAKGARTVQGEERRFFYNPMWGYFGDVSPGPPGTYYYNSSSQVNYYWNIFDQILIRPDLLERFNNSDVAILTSAGRLSLLSDQQIPNREIGSDHLPILLRLDLSKELL